MPTLAARSAALDRPGHTPSSAMGVTGCRSSVVSSLRSHPALRPGHLIRNPMSRYDFRTPRLYVDVALAAGAAVALDGAQANYLGNVLRLKAGDPVLVFNGRDGEWRATLARRQAQIVARHRGAHARADASARPALPVRPAQACAARLHGAEGGRDGRRAAAAGAHPACPGGAGEPRAHARERDRGGRAVRDPDAAGGLRAAAARAGDRGARARARCWCSATRTRR